MDVDGASEFQGRSAQVHPSVMRAGTPTTVPSYWSVTVTPAAVAVASNPKVPVPLF